MAFCEYSSEIVSQNFTSIDNVFLSDFLPNADGDYVKVYLYGLYKCNTSKDNTVESFSKVLQMDKEDIISIFYYWQEVGLVQVINVEPIMVKFLPIKNAIQKMKKYNVDKYTAFNISAQELIGSKMLTPREYEEFYYLIENLHMEKEAVLKVIDFCVKQKGENISVNYITTVAKSWAYDGVKTSVDVDVRIAEQEMISGDIVELLKAMGIKRQAYNDEYELYLKWTKNYEIPLGIVVYIAKLSKSKNFKKLEGEIDRCYSMKLFSEKEIDGYYKQLIEMLNLSKQVVKNLGLWYDDLTNVIDTYVLPWVQMGFDNDAVLKLSNYAFKTNTRTLEGLNNIINNMFKLGLLTGNQIDNYLEDLISNDKLIKDILCRLGIDRSVISSDRALYKIWLFDWNISEDLLECAIEESKDKYMPLQYLNRLLAKYHTDNIKTVDDAKTVTMVSSIKTVKSSSKTDKKSAAAREYTKQELDSLFDDIMEVEI